MPVSKLSVCVICKNEIQHIEDFLQNICTSLYEKDKLFIVDTGSTDGTIECIEKYKTLYPNLIHFHTKTFTPFAFDIAREYVRKLALEIYPEMDISLSIDVDEIFDTPFWRDYINIILNDENTSNIDQIYCEMIYDYYDVPNNITNPYKAYINKSAYTKPRVFQHVGKIFKANKFYWKYPVHETLEQIDPKLNINSIITDKFKLIHLQVSKKVSRDMYLNLMKDYLNKKPDDTRMIYLYARELMNLGVENFDTAIYYFKKYLIMTYENSLDNTKSLFNEIKRDRAEACIFIANMLEYGTKNKEEVFDEYMFWRIKTVSESPYSREGWFYLAKAFGMCNNKKLARELFKLCTKFNKETSLEVTCEMWDDNLLNKYLLSTI